MAKQRAQKPRNTTSRGRANDVEEIDDIEAELTIYEQAFATHRAEIEALKAEELAMPSLDLKRAGAVGHWIWRRDNQPERRAAFEAIAQTPNYDIAALDRLGTLALAATYARKQQVSRAAVSSEASVPEAIVKEATVRRGRMLKVLQHWLGDDEAISNELDAIRAGFGHQDLADDLDALAELYRRKSVRTLIENDTRHYDPQDLPRAMELSVAIFEHLGSSAPDAAKRWRDLAHRAWTLLLTAYEEHRAAGAFIFRRTEDVEATYPSLFTISRAARRRAGAIDEPEPTEPGTPLVITDSDAA